MAHAGISCGDTNFVCVVTGTNTTSAKFVDGNTYVINGAVIFQNSGVDLNIEPGAVIKFVPSSSSLTITSSARINANGNATKRIVFTSCRDQTVGANTSTIPSCSGNPLDQDYSTAISISSTAQMLPSDSLSFMSIKFATTGISLAKYIGSIHDINFSRFGRRTGSGNAIAISTQTGTEIYNNSFDINSNNTSGGVNAIQISSDYNGSIHDNNFNSRLASYGVYVSSGNFTGSFHDNNVTALASHGMVVTTSNDFNSSIYKNKFDINGNGGNYTGVYRSGSFYGNIYDNNFDIKMNAFGFYTLGTGNFDANIYQNSFTGLNLPRGIILTNSGYSKAKIYSNIFDMNGFTTSYGYAIQISNDFNGIINDNNFHLKQFMYGIYHNGASFYGNVVDNNFGLDRAYAIYHNSPIIYYSDINRNIFYSKTPKYATYVRTNYGYSLYQYSTGGTFPGSFCENTFQNFFNNGIVYTNGTFSGSFCKNKITDANMTIPYLFYVGSNFSGSIIDNNFSNMIGNYTNASYFLFGESYSGEIRKNIVFDFNNLLTTSYFIRLSGTPTTGNITDNNFTKIVGTSSLYLIAYTGIGTTYTNIQDNNMTNFRLNVTPYYQSSGTMAGTFRRNKINDLNTLNNAVINTSGVFSGAVYDNNFSNLYNTRVFYQYLTGSFTGDFNANIIDNLYFSTGGIETMSIAGFFSGKIYSNKISNITNSNIIYSTANFSGSIYNNKISNITGSNAIYSNAAFSGNIYNNLFVKNNSAAHFIYHASSNAFSGSIYNNTFTNFRTGTSYGVRNTGSFTGNILRNVFTHGSVALSGTFSGQVGYNAFFSITTIGGSANQHVGDQNTQTGFSNDPFLADNSDRNFLLNTDNNGGQKLVNTGNIDSTEFFMKRTTLRSNKLDTGIIDLGYHYDQNALYVIVQSPNGGEIISGTENIDFNVESGFGSSNEIFVTLSYSPFTSGGTQITSNSLNAFVCSSGPVYVCSYSWDSSDITDGNYYIILSAMYQDNNTSDSSDQNFTLLSIPKFALRTYLGSKPRGFFTKGQDVNIVVYTTTANPLINIIEARTGNILVSNASMSPTSPSSDMNGYAYSYKVDGNEGWYDARISGKTFEHIFYVTNAWQNRYVDNNGIVVPFSIPVDVTEPGKVQRWFAPIQLNLDFNYLSNPNGVRVIDYNGDTYVEIPSQTYDLNYSGTKASSGKVAFMASFDLGETRNFFANYSRQQNPKTYYPDMNLSFIDSNYIVENSSLKVEIDLNLGGNVTRIFNKKGTNTNLGGATPSVLSPESKSGIYTYTSYSVSNPNYSLDVNGGIFSKIRVWARTGQMDYNTTYYFYAKQPYYETDINSKPVSTQNWSYYYDDYKVMDSNKFLVFSYNSGGSVTNYDLNSNGSGSTLTFGDANYWGVYNRNTSDAFGTMFINRYSTTGESISSKFYDETDYDYWTRQMYSGIVTEADRFNSRIGHNLFNPWNRLGDLNSDFISAKYGLAKSIGTTQTNDLNAPVFVDWNSTPYDANDSADLNVWAVINDNLQVDYVDINISGPNINIQTRQQYNDANIVAYYVIDSNTLNAGTIDVNFRATDIAKNSTIKSWQISVSDLKAPKVWKITLTPDDNASIDPDSNITFDANINEYTGVSQVKLFIRYYNETTQGWSDWNAISMNFSSQPSDYNYNYTLTYNIPADLNKHFQYKIYTKDTQGNDANSDTNNFYAYIDYTWGLAPTNFGTKTEALDANITIGDINITNTGDAPITFSITSNWDPGKNVFFNLQPGSTPYEITVNAGQTASVNTKVTTKTTERSDSLTITFTPKISSAQPQNATSSGTIISLAGGPFMFVEIPTYNQSVLQGDTGKSYVAKVTNKGNEDANNVVLAWTLPEGWTITSGSSSVSISTLGIDEYLFNSIVVSISESAQSGTVTLTATATPDGNELKTRSESVNVVVVSTQTSQAPTCSDGIQNHGETGIDCGGPCPPCGGGVVGTSSASSSSSSSGGGGGGSIFTTEEQVRTFFQTVEKFELVRGKDQEFKVRIKNPFPDKELRNITAEVTGLLSKYLNIENPEIPSLKPDEESFLKVKIVAPKYFEPGRHELTFTIKGVLSVKKRNSIVDTPFTFKTNVTLFIRDITKKEAAEIISKAKSEIAELVSMGLNVSEMRNILEEAEINIDANEYDLAANNANTILALGKIAKEAVQEMKKLDELISKSEEERIDIPKTKKMRELAKLALDRGDFQNALDVLKEAHLTHSLETKGAFNYGYFIMQNSFAISTGAIAGILFFIVSLISLKRFSLKNKIKTLKAEEKLLIELIKETQHQCFVAGKISMNEYQDALNHYEKKFTEAIEKMIEAENELINQLNIKSKRTKLAEERERILNELKETQKQYFKEGLIETRMYQAKIENLTKRLNEIEKNITYEEAISSIRKNSGWLSIFWRVYYKIFK